MFRDLWREKTELENDLIRRFNPRLAPAIASHRLMKGFREEEASKYIQYTFGILLTPVYDVSDLTRAPTVNVMSKYRAPDLHPSDHPPRHLSSSALLANWASDLRYVGSEPPMMPW